MNRSGTVVRWDDARGFGFIREATSGDVFFHAKDFRASVMPRVGMRVSFEQMHVGGKGPRATDVRPLDAPVSGANARPRGGGTSSRPGPAAGVRGQPALPQPGLKRPARIPSRASAEVPATPAPRACAMPAFLLMLVWSGLLATGLRAGQLPPITPGVLLLLNLVTFLVYWVDKHAAQNGYWRISENNLHLLALAGGWPGAGLAQQVLRHKSRKASFRAGWWATVLLHNAALAAWIFRDWLASRGFLPA